MAQIAIFLISDGKYGPDLLLKLAYGAYILLNRALSTSICIVDDRGEIEFLARYYLVKALLLAKNTYVNNYNERGRDIGIILGFIFSKLVFEC